MATPDSDTFRCALCNKTEPDAALVVELAYPSVRICLRCANGVAICLRAHQYDHHMDDSELALLTRR